MIISIRDMVGKLIGIVTTILYVLDGSIKTMESAWAGPPGQMVQAIGSCFHPGTSITLANGKHYTMENLPLGDYLMVVQPNNKKLDSTIYKYEMITVSNIIHLEDENEEEDLFYVLDRRTGKPLQNIITKNDEETKRTDQLGKVGFKKKKYEKNTSYSSDVYFIHKNDTLVKKYNKGWLKDESYTTNEDEDFAAKPMLYFDRAIYRPGQTVFYKGILAQLNLLQQNLDEVKQLMKMVEEIV
mgnify:CR=1 FL=1